MSLTSCDLKLMHWINGLGFVALLHIMAYLKISRSAAYRQVKTLIEQEYLVYEKILYNEPGVYRVTSKGVRMVADDLSSLRKIHVANYHHQMAVVDICILLEAKFGEVFISERRLRRSRVKEEGAVRGHISDGLLDFGERKIALEVELSSKNSKRREAILKYYTRCFYFDELWYICKNEFIYKQIEPLLTKRPFVKLYYLEAFKSFHESDQPT